MSPSTSVTKVGSVPAPAARPAGALNLADAPASPRPLLVRLSSEWLPRAAWTINRTGRPGLLGIALLFAAALFLFSTHRQIAGEVESLGADLAAAQAQVGAVQTDPVPAPAATLRKLPARTEMPEILRQLFGKAAQAGLAVDTGKYEINTSGSGRVVRYQIAFPVTGPYPQIRTFIDTTLATMPAVSLSDLVIDRKSIAEGAVDAQLGMTIYTRSTP